MDTLTMSLTTFLRFSASTDRAKVSSLRKRASAESKGYDCHKIMKKLASQLAMGSINMAEAKSQIEKIKRPSERQQTKEAIERFERWFDKSRYSAQKPPKGTYTSSSGLVKILLEPELAFVESKRPVACTLWNLKEPTLLPMLAAKGLRLLRRELGKQCPHNFVVFDMQRKKLIGEQVITLWTDSELNYDLRVLETLWMDANDVSVTVDDALSHIFKLNASPA